MRHPSTHHFELLHVGGIAVVGLDERLAAVEDCADHHPQREEVTKQGALRRSLNLRRWKEETFHQHSLR